jgi:hypothetical protein
MQPIYAFASFFPGEHTAVLHLERPSLWFQLPFATFAQDLNRHTLTFDGYVLVLHGVEMMGDWAAPLIEAMDMGASMVWPWLTTVAIEDAVDPEGTLSGLAYLTHTDVLRRVGGLDTRVLFGHDRLLAHAVAAEGGWVSTCAQSVARITMDAARMNALGALYYRQIEDTDTINAILERNTP